MKNAKPPATPLLMAGIDLGESGNLHRKRSIIERDDYLILIVYYVRRWSSVSFQALSPRCGRPLSSIELRTGRFSRLVQRDSEEKAHRAKVRCAFFMSPSEGWRAHE